ncbi:hypothetical protein [Pseudalkalibacillus hwajinpoensis]|uniref:Uncharacterized protein n=1 Tax=Guptibacillus hwajinpoensis TaxID=208199 RepID=A0A4U1MJJ7_9BACL|nr:hypothetical protein [Pseudalkalibacillus hwajinpoensis]TKD70745.1 hypothetical protein FBF83_08995 [Pseudalkalibacillus hwajinpoensis]
MNKKYSTKEIASILHQSSTSNIRHIARHMEKLGYVIERDEYDRREYNETDKNLFSQIQELKDSGVKLREAIDSVLSNQEINDEKRAVKEIGISDNGLKTFALVNFEGENTLGEVIHKYSESECEYLGIEPELSVASAIIEGKAELVTVKHEFSEEEIKKLRL